MKMSDIRAVMSEVKNELERQDLKKRIKQAKKNGEKIGKKTKEEFGVIGGLLRVIFGKKKVIIDKQKGVYEIYDF